MMQKQELPSGWEKTTLGKVAKFGSGATKPSDISEVNSGGKYPVYGGNGIIGYSSEFNSEGPEIIIGRVGEKCGCVHVSEGACWVTDNALRIKDKYAEVYHHFFAEALKKARLENFRAKGGQPLVTQTGIGGVPINLPPLPEQKAIAALLSAWDEALDKTERLIQAKEASLKGQIQRIMGKKAIDANGWSMVHLGELFSEVTRKVGEKELTPYSISAGIGFVSQREKWGKDISGSQHKNYTHLKAGEFSYNKGNSKRYQQGCVYLLKKGEICVPNVFISFKPKAKNVVPEFFEHYFIANYHARELKRYITSGARSDGLLNLNKKDFFKIMVPCPSPEEQKAIAEVLTASQQEIDLLKQLADKYKTQKRGLMQKMLTGEWRVKPEIVNQYMEA